MAAAADLAAGDQPDQGQDLELGAIARSLATADRRPCRSDVLVPNTAGASARTIARSRAPQGPRSNHGHGMTSSGPADIIGYWIARKVAQSEIPASIPVRAKDVVGLLGGGYGHHHLVTPGIDVLELGILTSAGRFLLIPVNADRKSVWAQTVDLLVTPEQAATQRDISQRFYAALLAALPHDADDLHAAVTSDREQERREHHVFNLLGRAATEIWALERRPTEPLTDTERQRLEGAVSRRTVALLSEAVPHCRLDRQSLASIVNVHQMACSWDRILCSVAQGDYDDAVARVLARIKIGRGIRMPMSCLLQVLPGVLRLDIFFLFIQRASEHPAQALLHWVEERDPLGADPAAAELAVRVLYAIWGSTQDMNEAKSIMRTHLHRIRSEPSSDDARLIKVYLATALKVRGAYRIPEADLPLFNRVEAALERWDRALRTTIDEVIVSLPARVVDASA
jgi:hypothetical protein